MIRDDIWQLIRERINSRIAACEDAANDERECGDEHVAQALSEEALWLQALLVEIDSETANGQVTAPTDQQAQG